jgi:hypothetical protein
MDSALSPYERAYGIKLSSRPAGRQPRDIYNPLIDDQAEKSLLRDIGGVATGGLSMFGSALDLPGSMVRDTLSLFGNNPQNPFDQLLTPFSPDNRISGRDLMRSYGMVGNKDTWGNFATGLAAEMALDPLTYLTLGGSAVLTGAGKGAKAGGTLAKGIGNQIRAGQRGLFAATLPFSEKGIQVGTGKAAARIGDVLSGTADAIKFGNIPGTPYSPGRAFTSIMNPAARGVENAPVQRHALGPLREATEAARMDAGRTMGEIGGRLAESALDWSDPGVASRARSVMEHDAWTTLASQKGPNLSPDQYTALNQHLDDFYQRTGKWDDSAVTRETRNWLADQGLGGHRAVATRSVTTEFLKENADILGDAPTMESMQKFRRENEFLLENALEVGLDKHVMADAFVRHAHRKTPTMRREFGAKGVNKSREFGVQRAEDIGRQEILKNIPGGSKTIEKVAMDPVIGQAIDKAVEWNLGPDAIAKLIAKYHPEFNAGTQIRRAIGPPTQAGVFPTALTPKVRPVSAIDTFTGKPRDMPATMETLTKFSKWLMEQPRALREVGIFPNNPFFDSGAGHKNLADSVAVGKETIKFLAQGADAGITFHKTPTPDTIAISELLDSLGMGGKTGKGRRIALEEIRKAAVANYQELAKQVPAGPARNKFLADNAEAWSKLDDTMRVDRHVASALQKYTDGFRSPEQVGKFVQGLDSYTNLFKLGVTGLWPAYHVRNLLSSQWQNVVAGNWSGRSVGDAYRMINGGMIEDAAQIAPLRRILEMEGRPLTSVEATKLIRELAASTELIGRYEGLASDLAGATPEMKIGTLEDLTAPLPGQHPFRAGDVVSEFIGTAPGTTWDPRKMSLRGVAGATDTTIPPVKATESVGHFVESLARLSPFIHKLRRIPTMAKGEALDKRQLLKLIRDAADEVGASQVQYGSRHFAPIERDVFKRAIPFYSFSSRMLPWMLRELAEKPGGRLAQTIRASVSAKDPNEIMPEYVAETAAIPVAGGPLEALLGTPKDGGQRFVTGFGLAHEDPLAFFGKGLGGGLLEVLSRSNPLVKAPLQLATGQSFFQQGPLGGRPLEDLDPTIGRTIANLTGQENAVRYPGDRQVEALLETLPISRAATTLRTWSDPRKGIGAKIANTATGIRAADVSPHTQDALYREQMKAYEKRNLGARTFETTYTPDYIKERMTPEQLEFTKRLELMKRELVRRRQVRKAEDAKERTPGVVRIP